MSWYNPFSWGRKRKVVNYPLSQPKIETVDELTPEMIRENNARVERVNKRVAEIQVQKTAELRNKGVYYNPGQTGYLGATPNKKISDTKKKQDNVVYHNSSYESDYSAVVLGAAVAAAVTSTNTYEAEKRDFSGGGSTVDVDDTPSTTSYDSGSSGGSDGGSSASE